MFLAVGSYNLLIFKELPWQIALIAMTKAETELLLAANNSGACYIVITKL